MTSSVESLAPMEEAVGPKEVVGKSPLKIAWERLRKDKIAVVCMVVVAIYVIVAVFSGPICHLFGVSLTQSGFPCDYVVCGYSPDGTPIGLPITGPPFHGFDIHHPFGLAPATGLDNMANWIYGARTSLMLAAIATVGSTIIGIVLGLVAGYAGGIIDSVVSFFTDLFLTIPYLLAAIAFSAILADRFGDQPDKWMTWSFRSLIIILVVFGWMGTTRLIRGEVVSLREREFIQAARVIGVPTWRILFKEILPNLVAPIVVTISLSLPAYVSAEAGLSYLGIGVVGRASWGQTIDAATPYWESYPLYLWEPVIGIVVLVVALNLLGDAIRDALDPKTRR